MNLQQLETFLRVAEHGSFSKAALVLGVAQPALSRQVRALETELRDTLLVRTGRGVTLTESGRRLLEYCQDILHLVAQAKEDLSAQRHEPVGQITVAMPPTLARQHTLAFIQSFQAELPRARLAIMEGFSVHLSEWLQSGRIDIALIHNPEPSPALEILPLRQEGLSLFSPPGTDLGEVNWTLLSRLPLVMPQRGHIFRKLMESAAALAGVSLNVRWEVSSVPAILDLVTAGMGHAALGHLAQVQANQRDAELTVHSLDHLGLQSTLCLVTPAHKRSTPLTQRTAALLMRLVR